MLHGASVPELDFMARSIRSPENESSYVVCAVESRLFPDPRRLGTLESFANLLMKKRRKFKQPYKDRLYRRKWNKTPRGRYTEQRKRAISRGIEWQFTFESWWQLWQESGHWEERGKKAGCYVMARRGDAGPYSPGNCVIVQLIVNARGSALTAGIIRPEHAPEALPFADVPF